MLLSRFWYLFLAVTAAAAVGAALLAQGIINRQSGLQVGDQLRRDRLELEAVLRLEARSRLDRIAFITVDAKIGEVLQKARGVQAPEQLWKLNGELKEVLRGHIDRLAEVAAGGGTDAERRQRVAPAIVIAVDGGGRIVAQLGPLEMNRPGTGLGTFPLVRRAMQGYVRDDVWLYDRRVYRMAARPVIYQGEYVGAIIHGYRYDQSFAQTLSENLGDATIGFFYGTDLLASYSPPSQTRAPSETQLAVPLRAVLGEPKFARGERTDAIELKGGGLAVYSLVTGSAAFANVGYAIARPRKLLGSPLELFENATSQEVKSLPFVALFGGAIGLAVLGLLFVYLERDVPLRRLLRKLSDVAKDDRDRLIITEWRGLARKLADQINQAINRQVEKAALQSPTPKKKINLDEILGPTPSEQGAGAFFSFAQDGPGASDGGSRAAEEVPEAPPPLDEPPASQKLDLPPPPPPHRPGASPQGPSITSKGPPPPPPPRGRAASSTDTAKAAAPSTEQALPVPVATAPTVREPSDAEGAEPFDEVEHFKQVFEEYIKTRKDCGESVDGISFEKFLVTVRKNRDQIIAKHGAIAARFTVYVKEGKAALKATPIKKSLTTS
jgi:hypothetical protein